MVSKYIRIASTDMFNSKNFSGEIPRTPLKRGGMTPSRALPPLEPSALAERLCRSMAVPLFKKRRRPWDFNIPTDSWEQAAQDQTKWYCLIKKGADQYEAKRIYEVERKRKERTECKEKAKGSTSVITVHIYLLFFQPKV